MAFQKVMSVKKKDAERRWISVGSRASALNRKITPAIGRNTAKGVIPESVPKNINAVMVETMAVVISNGLVPLVMLSLNVFFQFMGLGSEEG